jgi:hypothetical protein
MGSRLWGTRQDLLLELSKLPPQTIVLFTTLFRDGTGKPFVPHNIVPRISAAANAPTYGFLDQFVGRGIVGGHVYSSALHGTQNGKLVLRVLADAQPSGASLLEAPSNKVLFDWRQMQRWGITARQLPSDSEIHNRELRPLGTLPMADHVHLPGVARAVGPDYRSAARAI